MVSTTFGLRMQVQLVPVMQLFLTLDQASQGRVQGEWPPGLPHRGLPCPRLPCPLLTMSWPLRPLRELQRPGR